MILTTIRGTPEVQTTVIPVVSIQGILAVGLTAAVLMQGASKAHTMRPLSRTPCPGFNEIVIVKDGYLSRQAFDYVPGMDFYHIITKKYLYRTSFKIDGKTIEADFEIVGFTDNEDTASDYLFYSDAEPTYKS
jgi:hypothetical protein